jgi:hypothetical protein
MIILGVVLLIVGFLAGIPIIWTLGIIALVIGLILAIVGASGRGRRGSGPLLVRRRAVRCAIQLRARDLMPSRWSGNSRLGLTVRCDSTRDHGPHTPPMHPTSGRSTIGVVVPRTVDAEPSRRSASAGNMTHRYSPAAAARAWPGNVPMPR